MAETRLHWDDYETMPLNQSIRNRTPLIGSKVTAYRDDIVGDGLGNIKWIGLGYSGEVFYTQLANTTQNQQNQGTRIVYNDGGQDVEVGLVIRGNNGDPGRFTYLATYRPRLNGGTVRFYYIPSNYTPAQIGSDIIHSTTLGEDITFAFACVDGNHFYIVINDTVVLDTTDTQQTPGSSYLKQGVRIANVGGGTTYQALRIRQREVFDFIELPSGGEDVFASGSISSTTSFVSTDLTKTVGFESDLDITSLVETGISANRSVASEIDSTSSSTADFSLFVDFTTDLTTDSDLTDYLSSQIGIASEMNSLDNFQSSFMKKTGFASSVDSSSNFESFLVGLLGISSEIRVESSSWASLVESGYKDFDVEFGISSCLVNRPTGMLSISSDISSGLLLSNTIQKRIGFVAGSAASSLFVPGTISYIKDFNSPIIQPNEFQTDFIRWCGLSSIAEIKSRLDNEFSKVSSFIIQVNPVSNLTSRPALISSFGSQIGVSSNLLGLASKLHLLGSYIDIETDLVPILVSRVRLNRGLINSRIGEVSLVETEPFVFAKSKTSILRPVRLRDVVKWVLIQEQVDVSVVREERIEVIINRVG